MIAPAPRFVSVGQRLAVWTTLLIIVAGAGVSVVLVRFQWQTTQDTRTASALEVMNLFRELAAAPLVFHDDVSLSEVVRSVSKNPDVRLVRVTSLEPGGNQRIVQKYLATGWPDTEPLASRSDHFAFDDRVVIHADVVDSDQQPIGRATLVFSLERERTAAAALRLNVIVGTLALSAALIITLLALTRARVLRPLGRLTFAANQLERGELVPLDTSTQDEVGELSRVFERMARTLRERELALAQQNHHMRLVLDNVAQGFVLLDARAHLVGEHSKAADDWFGQPGPDAQFTEWVAPHDARFRTHFSLIWDDVTAGLDVDLCLRQLPTRLARNERTYECAYRALAAGSFEGIVVVINDITAELAQRASSLDQRQTVALFQHLLKDPDTFFGFLNDGDRSLLALERSTAAPEHFRVVHTLKGNCAILGLPALTESLHALEERLALEGRPLSATEYEGLRTQWAALRQQAHSLRPQERSSVEVTAEALGDFRAELAAHAPPERLLSLVDRWSYRPARRTLDALAERARNLAQLLKKTPVEVAVDCDDTRLPPGPIDQVCANLAHVVRNAIDHGLEAPADRASKGPAHLALKGQREGNRFRVTIEDDGRGIQWSAVATRAKALGLPSETPEALVEALFADGLSTATTTTTTSGRGVGLSALRQAVRAAGGDVCVESEIGRRTRWRITVPLDQPEARHV